MTGDKIKLEELTMIRVDLMHTRDRIHVGTHKRTLARTHPSTYIQSPMVVCPLLQINNLARHTTYRACLHNSV